ncbi:MAG: copper chaperone PCu(A)C [Chloroflexaceae bacterium]|nr:copper chaperone PCu(A)C [Chloroflexaceae bacterium]
MKHMCQLIALMLMFLLVACGTASGTVTVNDPWVRATAGQPGAANQTAAPMHDRMEDTGHSLHGDHGMSSDQADGSGLTISAAYMTLVNESNRADALLAATTDVAETVELHQTVVENDIMQMRQVDSIPLPAGSTVELKPGDYHLMLVNLKHDLKEGEMVTITLTLQDAGTITVTAPVQLSQT